MQDASKEPDNNRTAIPCAGVPGWVKRLKGGQVTTSRNPLTFHCRCREIAKDHAASSPGPTSRKVHLGFAQRLLGAPSVEKAGIRLKTRRNWEACLKAVSSLHQQVPDHGLAIAPQILRLSSRGLLVRCLLFAVSVSPSISFYVYIRPIPGVCPDRATVSSQAPPIVQQVVQQGCPKP